MSFCTSDRISLTINLTTKDKNCIARDGCDNAFNKTAKYDKSMLVLWESYHFRSSALNFAWIVEPFNRISASTNATYIFFFDWIIPSGILLNILSDNGMQLASRFFATLLTPLGKKWLTTTAYHPSTNGQMKP